MSGRRVEATVTRPREPAAADAQAPPGAQPDRSPTPAPARARGPTRRGRLRAWWRKEARPFWRDVRWIAVAIGALTALVLGYLGFDEHLDAVGEPHSFGDTLYRSLQLFGLEGGDVGPPVPWQLEAARVLAPVVAVYAAVSAIAALLREQLELVRMRFLRDHVVVCGLGERGLRLAKGFNARGDRVVAIESDDAARGLGELREEGVLVLVGDATDRTTLRKARVERARHLVAVAADDGANAETALETAGVVERRRAVVARFAAWIRERLLRRRSGVLAAFVHVVDPRLCSLLRQSVIASPKTRPYRLGFFNVYEIAARILVREYLHPAGGDGSSKPRQRLVVVGLGEMGEALVIHAAKAWRAIHPESHGGLQVAIVDQAAERKCESLLLRYPHLRSACELDWHQMDIEDPDFSSATFLVDETGTLLTSVVYVCVDDDALGLRAAQALLPSMRRRGIPIVVRMRQRAGLATLMGADGSGGEDGLHLFPLVDRTCEPELLFDETRELLARIIHKDYVRHQREQGETPETKPSVADWRDLDEKFKESSRAQADHIGVKLTAVGYGLEPLTDWNAHLAAFSPEEVERLAELEHERWCEERLADGWSWGPHRDYGEQTHPDLVPWERLAEAEREVDRDAVRGLPASLATAGFRVYRRPDADG